MSEKVPDPLENMEIYKRFCRSCSTFKTPKQNEFKTHILFYAPGKSEKPTDQIVNEGCYCPDYGVFIKILIRRRMDLYTRR